RNDDRTLGEGGLKRSGLAGETACATKRPRGYWWGRRFRLPHRRGAIRSCHLVVRQVGDNESMPTAASSANPRDQLLQAIQRIYQYRMTTTSGGNLSIRERSGHIWITPARLDKGSLKREDMVCVRPNG